MVDSIMNKKMLAFQITFVKYFVYIRSLFDQIIKNCIFSKSSEKGLLKNVQDGIYRPLGNRAIQKTKGETDLLDTL